MTAENEPNKESNATDSDTAQEAEQQPVQGPGEILKLAREAKGLEQREVADELRLRKQIIALLEADDYDTFSTPTFIKGYLRAYAKLLDVDEVKLFAAYKAKGYQEVQSTQMQSFSRRMKHQESDSRLMFITYVVIIIVVGLVIWWWQDSGIGSDKVEQPSSEITQEKTDDSNDISSIEVNSEPRQPEIEPNTEEAVLESDVSSSDTNISMGEIDTDTDVAEQSVEKDASEQNNSEQTQIEQSNEPISEPVEENTADESVSSEVPVEQSEPVSQEQGPPSEEITSRLVVEFNQECWVKIDDAAGETQAVGVKAAGYTMQVPGEPPFSVTMCEPDAATFSLDGNNVDMSQFRRGRVARFTVPMSD